MHTTYTIITVCIHLFIHVYNYVPFETIYKFEKNAVGIKRIMSQGAV